MAMPKELTFRLIEGTELAVSPDGERIVFRAALANGTRRLYLRNLDSLQPPTMLPATDYGRLPFWSPDGNAIAFFADHKLKRVNIVEGTVQVVCEARSARGGSWNSDGMIIFAPAGGANGLYVVSAEGGTPRQVTTLNRRRGETAHVWPSFLSDGHRFLYSIDGNDASRAGTYVQVLGSERHTRVLGVTSNVSYAAGHLLFANAESLMAVPFSLEEGRVIGEPYQVGAGVATFPRRADFSAGGGVLGYWRGSEQVDNITWLGHDGRLLHTFPAPDLLVHPDLSADGRFLAFSKGKDIWVLDSASGVHSRLTMTASADYYPVWSPDGKQLVFASDQPRHGMYLVDMSNGQQTRLLAEGDELYPTDWSRDGNYLVYEKKDAATGTRDVWVLPLIGDRKPIPVAATRADERNGQISPDNHWVSYTARDSGYWQVYLTALQGAGRVRQISSGQGVQPKWAADRNELFYLRPDRQLMATTISGTSELQFSLPRPLFHVDAADVHPRGLYSVTADVRRFMFITSPPPDQELITIVTNWSRPRRARY
jgi:Tol biopolymer transport system component